MNAPGRPPDGSTRGRSGNQPQRRALIRRPSSRLADGITTHIERTVVDTALAQRQWDAYAGALSDAGWDLTEVAPVDGNPDGVFVEDTVIMIGALAVLARPGAESRRGEVDGTATALRALGYRTHAVVAPGTLDGGDVLKIGARVYVGRGGRTNADGVRQLRALVTREGGNVTAIPMTKALHLKSAVTALPDGTVIGYPPVVDEPDFFPHFRAMAEEAGAHVVDLGGDRLLMSAAAPHSADLVADLGYEPVLVDISEFEKLEGCVTCLSVRLRVAPD